MTGDARHSKDDRTDTVPADRQTADAAARTDSQVDDITPAHTTLEASSAGIQAQPVEAAAAPAPENPAETLIEIRAGGMQEMVQRGGAFVFSTIFHLVLVLVLGLCTLNTAVQEEIISLLSPSIEEQPDELPVELELEQDLQAATEVTQAIFDSAVAAAAQSGLVVHGTTASNRIGVQQSGCAEVFQTGKSLIPGTVVCLAAGGKRKVQACRTVGDPRLLGVVVESAGLLSGDASGPKAVCVALFGTADCCVEADSGPVEVGDLLTPSNVTGHARRVDPADVQPGALLGKALAPLKSGRGVIPIVVMVR